MLLEVLALFIALTALVLAAWAWQIGRRTSRRLDKLLQRRKARRDGHPERLTASTLRAELRYHLRQPTARASYLLVIRNLGAHAAESIEVLIDGVPAKKHPLVVRDSSATVTRLAPYPQSGNEIRLRLSPASALASSFRLKVYWVDATGKRANAWDVDLDVAKDDMIA